MREKIWYKMLECKYQAFYFEELATKFQIWDRNINIFLALSSLISIATWAVSGTLEFLWASIIAFSSVVTVIKPFFPFHKYINKFNIVSTQLHNLNLDFEKLWYQFENNRLDEAEIFNEFFELKKRSLEIFDFDNDTIISEYPEQEEKAKNLMSGYLKNNFDVEYQ